MGAKRTEIRMAPIEVIRNFYDALKRGDIPALVALLSDDLSWTEAEGFPSFSGLGGALKKLLRLCVQTRYVAFGLPRLFHSPRLSRMPSFIR